MDAPATVAVPLPMCRARSGSVALHGTSLGDWRFRSQRWLFRLLLRAREHIYRKKQILPKP